MKEANAMYTNKQINVCYRDDEIFETKLVSDTGKSAIINIFLKLFCSNDEQRIIFYTLLNSKDNWTIVSLCKYLSDNYDKSERTYRRNINELIGNNIIKYELGILSIAEDYDISQYNLSNVKSIMIHITNN